MRKLHRKTGPRRSFLKLLANNLIIKGRIVTTTASAKEIRPVVERFVSIAKRQNLASLRPLLSKLPKQAAEKMYHEISPRYQERKGGYTRIIKTSRSRKRDGVIEAIIEFV